MNNNSLKFIIAILVVIAISLITIVIQNNSNSNNSRNWGQSNRVEYSNYDNYDRAESCARNRQIEIMNCNNDSACLQRLMNKYAGTSCGD